MMGLFVKSTKILYYLLIFYYSSCLRYHCYLYIKRTIFPHFRLKSEVRVFFLFAFCSCFVVVAFYSFVLLHNIVQSL